MPVFPIDKPLGVTSHDVVAGARRRLGTRRVGHAGTLDPLASGVLVLLSEEETKLSPFLTDTDKSYLAWVSFGATTPTLDAEGPLLPAAPAGPELPQPLRDAATGRLGGPAGPAELTPDAIERALPPFLELTEQAPPAYSAVKVAGVRGYQAARRGERVELAPRPAGYRRLELLAVAESVTELPDRFAPAADGTWRPDPAGRRAPLPPPLGHHPTALVALTVTAGTYVRAFARDLGAMLGSGAFLSGLLRTRAGGFGLDEAVAPDALDPAAGLGAARALPYPLVTLTAEEAERVRLGQRLPARFEGRAGLVGPGGELVAVAEANDGRMRLLRVWRA